jgi:glutamyl-tRNA reductase
MSMSTYYRGQAQRCLALSRACSDRAQGAQLIIMANRYFERAEELEGEVRFQTTPVLHHEEVRAG